MEKLLVLYLHIAEKANHFFNVRVKHLDQLESGLPYDPQKHHRRSIRLKGYDYSRQGAYFVTLVCQHRDCLFGDILDGSIRFSKPGEIVEREWRRIERNFPFARIDEFVIMPDHLHGIIWIRARTGEASAGNHAQYAPINDVLGLKLAVGNNADASPQPDPGR